MFLVRAMSVTSLPISLERVWFRSPRSLVTELRARARCASHPAHFGAQSPTIQANTNRSKVELQAHLDLPGSAEAYRPSKCVEILPKGACSNKRVGLIKIGVIKYIEHFDPELEIARLTDFGILDYGKINLFETRAEHRIAPQVAKCPRGRDSKGRWIQPLVHAPGMCIRIDVGHSVRPLVSEVAVA